MIKVPGAVVVVHDSCFFVLTGEEITLSVRWHSFVLPLTWCQSSAEVLLDLAEACRKSAALLATSTPPPAE